jgi:carbon starvation protein CstA
VAAPITSGDTAFRSARLTIADAIHLKQEKIINRFIIAIPLFAIGTALCFIDFAIIWRYFAWSNQTLATIVLWASAVYLAQNNKFHWICSLPATFMTAVVTSYIIIAPEGLKLGMNIGMPIGLACAALCFTLFILQVKKLGTSSEQRKPMAS